MSSKAIPRLLFSLFAFTACAGQDTSSSGAQITGDHCAVHVDAETCAADEPCQWFGTGADCPAGTFCPSGSCVDPTQNGSGDGSGSTGTACACPGDGVCYEQIGGPAQQGEPSIECTTPTPGDAEVCSRIQGQGTCQPSATVGGLCICDNGIR